jgi:hypothetical protein
MVDSLALDERATEILGHYQSVLSALAILAIEDSVAMLIDVAPSLAAKWSVGL